MATVSTRDVLRECKMRGLSLRADAARAMQSAVSQSNLDPGQALRFLVDGVRQRLERSDASRRMVDVEVVSAAIAEARQMTQNESAEADRCSGSALVLEAWRTPALEYDGCRHRFVLRETIARARPLSIEVRSAAYHARYELTWQRVSRTDFGRGLSRLDAAICGTRVCVFGVLTDDADGSLWLEDPYGRVRVRLTAETQSFGGYFAEGMCVVVEGLVGPDGTLEVAALGHPPPESRADAERAAGGQHLGVFSRPPAQKVVAGASSPWLFIAEAHLDCAAVLPRFRAVLDGLVAPAAQAYKRALNDADEPPPRLTLVLMGNFVSPALSGTKAVRELRARFADIGTLLCSQQYDDLYLLVDLVIVPGPRDPGVSSALPRSKLPDFVVEPLLEKLAAKRDKHDDRSPSITLTTSPCRLRAPGGEEIVVHRHDLARKLGRLSARLFAGENPDRNHDVDKKPADHVVKTLIDQGHLAPLALGISPVLPQYDHALRLYPPPHALALADDSTPPFITVYDDCHCFNPGSFARDGTFLVYDPISGRCDASKVP